MAPNEISPTQRTLDLMREEWTRPLRDALQTIKEEAEQARVIHASVDARWLIAVCGVALRGRDA